MDTKCKVLTILGSPHDKRSNTRALITDFLDEVDQAGLPLERTWISLGTQSVRPCNGCWNCTIGNPCPLRDDDLEEIKAAMLDCDLLIMACPVYTNQVTAQLKALFDRLFTWCHIFPLLGKYSLSVCTTGNDGQREVSDYLEKMLATYGTSSFGTIIGTGSYTPGFFPRRELAREKHKKLAHRVAKTISERKDLRVNMWQKRMFKAMKRKLTGVHALDFIQNGPREDRPNPPALMVRMIKKIMAKRNFSDEQLEKLSKLMSFELGWWTSNHWLSAKSFDELKRTHPVVGFDRRSYLLHT